MATVMLGQRCVVGVVPLQPIRGLPPGLARIRLRANAFGQVFVRDEDGIRRLPILIDGGGGWYCDERMEQGRNWRAKR
jgi:hypothetical protein